MTGAGKVQYSVRLSQNSLKKQGMDDLLASTSKLKRQAIDRVMQC